MVGEIVVTAQRREERLKDVPLSVAAATGAQLARAGISDTRGLQQLAPGLTFTTQGAWAQPNLRGVTTVNSGPGEESPIALYVDGVFQANQVGSLFQLPDVSQVQVLKGPQGTLFGRNAEGGAILITTREPQFTAAGDLTATYGFFTGSGGSRSSPEYGIKGFLTAPLVHDVLAGSVSFFTDRVDGYLNNLATGSRDGSINTQAYRAKLLFEPTSSLKFLASGWYSKQYDNANTAANIPPGLLSSVSAFPGGLAATNTVPGQVYPDGIVPSGQWDTAHNFPTYINTETYGGSLRATWDTDAGQLSSLTAYNHVRVKVRVNVSGGWLPDSPLTYSGALSGGATLTGTERSICFTLFACIDYQVPQQADSYSQEFVWTSKQYERFNYVAGVFLYRSREDSGVNVNATDCPGCAIYDTRVRTTSYAAFAEGNYKVTDQLTLTFGGRYSHDNKDGFLSPTYPPTTWSPTVNASWGSFTPRVSLRYAIDDQTNAYFTFSKGFKSGVINPTPPFSVAAPEQLTAYEVGVKRNTATYSLSLAAFYYKYRDIQVQTFDGVNTITNNAAEGSIAGIDFDGSVRITPDFTLRLAGSYIPEAKYNKYEAASWFGPPLGPFGMAAFHGSVDGGRLIRTPRFQGTLTGSYTHELEAGKIDASLSLYYTDRYPWELGYRVFTDSYATLNGQIAFTPAGSNFTITVFGRNLTNTWYLQSLVESANSDMSVSSAPREIGMSVGYKF